MLVVSANEFKNKQESYLEKIDAGIEILIQNRKKKKYKIVPVPDDDTLMSKEAFYEKIDRSLQEAEEGKTIAMLPNESLDDFLTRIQGCI